MNINHRLIPAIMLGALMGASTFQVLAVDDDGEFELGDGLATPGSADIVGSGSQAGPDWADIFDAGGVVVNLFGGIAADHDQDDLSLKGLVDDTIFASSNKNGDAIPTWQWDTGNNPPKDDISTTYVYAKSLVGGLRIYGGLERIDSNGDAHLDIEFNQSGVGLDKDPECEDDETAGPGDGPPCEYVGDRSVGDFVVAMDFEKGGDFGILRVYVWDGVDYFLVETVENEGCNPGGGSVPADSICAFNNDAPIDGGPWPNYTKGSNGPVDMIPANGFTEFGIDVDAVLGLLPGTASPCFAAVNFKSRSSQSFTSELKDFAIHPFEECTATVSTEVRTNPGDVLVANDASPTPTVGSVPVGTVVDDTATVTGISGLPPNGDVYFYLHNTIDCSDDGTQHGSEKTLPGSTTPESVTSDTLTLTNPGDYGFTAVYEGDSNYPEATGGCEAFTVNPVDTSVTTQVVTGSGESETDVTNTALDLGTTVRDKAMVMGDATLGAPTGTVTFRRWTNADCTGTFTDEDVALTPGLSAVSTAYSGNFTLEEEAFHCWEVFYNGEDADYNSSAATVGEPICAFDFNPSLTSD